MRLRRVWIWTGGFSEDLQLDLADLYRPIVQSLAHGLASPDRVVETVGGAQSFITGEITGDDVFIIVGPAQWSTIPWEQIRLARPKLIMYQTEPIPPSPPTWLIDQLASGLDEVWDYSHANLAHLRRLMKRTGPVLRHVPPGYAPAIDGDVHRTFDGASPVAFLGMLFGDRRPTLDRMMSTGLEIAIVERAFSNAELSATLARHSIYVNLHKRCGDSSQPVEMLRMALLLSNGRFVISELSNKEDMRELSPWVRFCALEDIPEVVRSVRADPDTAVLARRNRVEFIDRFGARAILRRAGVADL